MLRPREERGAVAVLVAASLLLLMGITAIVIDGGVGFSERRQAQSGVDFAALAALTAATGTNPEDTGAQEAIDVVAANLPGRTLDWAACTDAARPAEYTLVSSLTDCVSYTENFEQARVVLPTNAVDTSFGRVLGVQQMVVGAAAEAEQNIQTTADVLPFTAMSGSHVCLFSNQAPQTVPPCNGPGSGTFGYLDVALYGSNDLGNPWTCDNGTSNVRSAINIAKGSDHLMVEWDAGDPIVNDHDACVNRSENVNELVVQTGSPTNGATEGLVTGISGSINGESFTASEGRIFDATSPRVVRGHTLDDTPLWTFLVDPTCGGAIAGGVDTHAEMETCLNGWTSGPLFTAALQDHPRFGAVPVFTVYPSGPGSYLIDHFSPVWIETIYMDCNSNKCDTIFTPGETTGPVAACPSDLAANPGTINCGHSDTSGPDDVEGLTAFQLQIGMLDPDTQEFFPGTLSSRSIALLH